ncbi:hypothetical protein V2G26_009667 [Clonostachys chloroleuca]
MESSSFRRPYWEHVREKHHTTLGDKETWRALPRVTPAIHHFTSSNIPPLTVWRLLPSAPTSMMRTHTYIHTHAHSTMHVHTDTATGCMVGSTVRRLVFTLDHESRRSGRRNRLVC